MKRKILLSILTGITILICLSYMTIASYAVSQADADNLKKQINNAKNELNEISENKDNAESELESLTNKVTEVENKLSLLQAQLNELNNSIKTKEQEIETQEKEIEKKDKLLKQRMVALYEAGETSYLDVLFSSESLLDFLSGYSIVQTIAQSDTELINELKDKKQSLENSKTELENQKSEVENLKSEQEVQKANLKVVQAQKQEKVNALSAEEQAKQSEIDSYNKAMAKVNEELARIAEQAKNQINNANGGNGLKFDGSFIWPCNNKIVTSRMKYRWGRWHKGIDIGASYENVYASASGYAYNAYDRDGYGIYIMVFHGGGYVTLYGHLSSSKISNGQYVSQGQTIATSGNSGGSYGAHLHFEIRQANSISEYFSKSALDPLDYLPGGYTLAAGA